MTVIIQQIQKESIAEARTLISGKVLDSPRVVAPSSTSGLQSTITQQAKLQSNFLASASQNLGFI